MPGPRPELVLDNSIVMAWSFTDEVDACADTMLDRLAIGRAVVPALWQLEVANALVPPTTPTTWSLQSAFACRWPASMGP